MTDEKLGEFIGLDALAALRRYGGPGQVQLLKNEIQKHAEILKANPSMTWEQVRSQLMKAAAPILANMIANMAIEGATDEAVALANSSGKVTLH